VRTFRAITCLVFAGGLAYGATASDAVPSGPGVCTHDVGAVAIVAPSGTVDSGTVHTPRAVIYNFGYYRETFPVTMRIEPGYSQTVQCTLAVGQTDTVGFSPDWVAQPVGLHATVCYTNLCGDQHRDNDTVRGCVEVVNCRHDVGATAILAPVGVVDSGTVRTPRAVIYNFGNRDETFPVTFQIGSGYADSITTMLSAGQTDTVSFRDWAAEPVDSLATLCFTSLVNDADRSNDTARNWVKVIQPERHDVGATAILAPSGTVDSGTTHTPSAVIQNFGTRDETFPVTFNIGSSYTETIQASLAAGRTDTVDFPDWVAQPLGQHPAVCYTSLASDQDRSNDTVYGSVTVVLPERHDVGALQILSPTDTVDSGTVHTPRAVIYNFGNRDETFPVTFQIGSGYADSITTMLSAGQTDTVSFRDWVAEPVDSLATLCFTSLVNDADRSNDTVRDWVKVVQPARHDVGAVEILWPKGAVDSGTVGAPQAVIRNHGNRDETFPVTFRIGVVYSESLSTTLAVGETDTIAFPSWTAQPIGGHTTVCFTQLANDGDRTNDTVYGGVCVVPRARHDVGATEILAPVGIVDSGTVHTPRAVIYNFGNRSDSFPVTFNIGSSYSQTVRRTLLSGQTDTVDFLPSWVAQPLGQQEIVCYTGLWDDQDRSNDTVRSSVEVVVPERHDVGATAILAPSGTVDSGTTHTPSAVVQNFGTRDETFPVTFNIGSSYTETIQASLAAGRTDTVDFPDWVAEPLGQHPVVCYTSLASDQDRSNDTVYGSVTVVLPERHDVGATAILAPVGVVDSGTAHDPRAVIHNFGTRAETFPVTFEIGADYSRTVSRTLLSGQTDTVDFPFWIARPPGTYGTKCYTSLAFDEDRSNDTSYDSVRVVVPDRHDVGVAAILAPVGVVDSGTVLGPRAVVWNYGNHDEDFPVTFLVSAVYAESTRISLGAGCADTVDFPAWVAQPVDSHPTVCYTGLDGDEDRSNDTARNWVKVVSLPRHDVGVTAILAPSGVVDSGTVQTPAAVIGNFGNRDETFRVAFGIGGVYDDSVRRTLASGQTDTVIFPFWIAQPPDSYPTICYTRLADDEDRSNDTAYGFVVVSHSPPARHDVGTVGILGPAGSVDSNSVHTPRAVVHNSGDRNETFPVCFQIGSGYSDSLTRTLLPGQTDTVNFRFWVATPPGTYPTLCFTSLGSDEDRSNDTAYGSVEVRPGPGPDVGVAYVLAPVGTADSGTSVIPLAVVERFARELQTSSRSSSRVVPSSAGREKRARYDDEVLVFPVTMEIGESYRQTMQETLPAYGIDTVAFPAWTAASVGAFEVTSYTELAADRNRANDTARAQVSVLPEARHDVAAVAILAPTGTAQAGSHVTPQAVVRNLGTRGETFPVTMSIGADYLVTVLLESIPSGATDTASFTDWHASAAGVQPVVCYTSLTADENRSNDTVASSVQVLSADVAAIEILAPAGESDSGTVETPRAVVKNNGPGSAAFPVTMAIGTGYAGVTQVTLSPGQTDTVDFPAWVASPVGTHGVVCYTGLVGDPDPSNDTVRGRVDVIPAGHDVGTEAILAPTGRAVVDRQPWTTPVSPQARIVNYTAHAEPGFEVRFRIESRTINNEGNDTTWKVVYERTQTVGAGLPAEASLDVSFPDTSLGFGFYAVSCSTMLAPDADRANDRATAEFLVTGSAGQPEHVDVKIYTRAGERVRQFSRSIPGGSPPWIVWDRANDQGQRVAPGTYICFVAARSADQSVEQISYNVLVTRTSDQVRLTWRKP